MSELALSDEMLEPAEGSDFDWPGLRLVANNVVAQQVEVDYFNSLSGNEQIAFPD